MGEATNQLATLKGLDHAGESPFGDAGLVGHVPGLLGIPNPQNPEDREGDPAEVVFGQTVLSM